MHVSVRIPLTLFVASLFALLAAVYAKAAPITVNLRVEGSTKTLYEGSVATGAESISTTSSGGAHECDVKDNGANGGFGVSSGTPTTALYDAALVERLSFDATWSSEFNDFLVTQVGSDANETKAPFASWGYAVNYTTAGVGGCQFQLAPGSEVLWAYNYFNLSHLLSLSGPASANVGTPFALHVVDGQTGAPIAGAAIGEDVAGVTTTIPGSSLTDAEGNATILLSHLGAVKLKATQAESVRSGGLAVCVHSGNDGTCGTSAPGAPKVEPAPFDRPPPVFAVTPGGVKSGHHYRRGKGPRILTGTVQVSNGRYLRAVRISLQRKHGRKCQTLSGAKAAFVRSRCGVARFFSVGNSTSFSYLLPNALPAGSYVYEVQATEAGGSMTAPITRTSHVVFYVR